MRRQFCKLADARQDELVNWLYFSRTSVLYSPLKVSYFQAETLLGLTEYNLR